MDGTVLVPGVTGLDYSELEMPVAIMAGQGDKIVGNRQAERLHVAVAGSTLRIVESGGHMVHHFASRTVVESVAEILRRSGGASPADQAA